MFRRAKLWLDAIDPGVVEAALGSQLLVARLGLTDAKGHPLCASVRPPLVEWSAGSTRPPHTRRARRPICWHTMKRTHGEAPRRARRPAATEAAAAQLTISELTREAIERTSVHRRVGTRHLLAAGAGASCHDDISERIEEILADEAKTSR